MTLMAHKFATPTEAELENLVIQVYQSMPSADQSKLSLIENRLLLKARKNNKKSLNKMPWWIVLVLAGGFVTAAWWTGDNWFANKDDKLQQEELNSQHDSSHELNSKQMNKEQLQDDNENHQGTDTPVIYQREEF